MAGTFILLYKSNIISYTRSNAISQIVLKFYIVSSDILFTEHGSVASVNQKEVTFKKQFEGNGVQISTLVLFPRSKSYCVLYFRSKLKKWLVLIRPYLIVES
jgi:hypothetical protein